jgi:hypothetical protein
VNLKKMALKKVDLGNFTAGAPGNFYGYCAPYVGKTDNSQKTYLVVGNIDGNIERYDENFVNNLGNFTRIDSNYSFIKTPARAVPAFADLDGDGYYELVVGNKLGGLHYYKQVISVSTTHFSLTENSVDLYPNPVQNTFSLLFKKPLSNQTAVIRISDLAGRIVYRETFETGNKSRFDISALQPGVYNIELEMQGQKIWKKIIRN